MPENNQTKKNTKGTALITGASSGIGKEFAKKIAALDFNVILVARRKQLLEELAAELEKQYPIKAEILVADLATEPDITSVEDRIKSGNITILINNAGFGVRGPFISTDLSKRLNMIKVHITTPVRFCHAALPKMISQNKGAIINVSSLNAFMYAPGSSIYSSSKMFLVRFTQVLNLESPKKIRIMALCPGFTHTGFHSTEEYDDWDKTNIPKFLWMNASKVVSQSLNALRKGKVVFVPGFKNRIFLSLYRFPLTSLLIKSILIKGAKNREIID
ncbi:MAG: SDR family NAD(P)-dependent oxidoreductase [Candidatus Lokiarchaeota archaeon]|nr:SDR family NAD(P)-dependent oxidoreductase [Candidatus Lokiarchaeota archaeon]